MNAGTQAHRLTVPIALAPECRAVCKEKARHTTLWLVFRLFAQWLQLWLLVVGPVQLYDINASRLYWRIFSWVSMRQFMSTRVRGAQWRRVLRTFAMGNSTTLRAAASSLAGLHLFCGVLLPAGGRRGHHVCHGRLAGLVLPQEPARVLVVRGEGGLDAGRRRRPGSATGSTGILPPRRSAPQADVRGPAVCTNFLPGVGRHVLHHPAPPARLPDVWPGGRRHQPARRVPLRL